jgi:hypothetical protein
MVRFLVVEPTHPGSNPIFDMGVAYLWLIILSVVGDVSSTARHSLIDFVNLKIKLARSFGGAYRGRICVRVYIGVSVYTCMNICVCIVWYPAKKSKARHKYWLRREYYYEYDLADSMKCLIILLVTTYTSRFKIGYVSSSVSDSGCWLKWYSSSPRAWSVVILRVGLLVREVRAKPQVMLVTVLLSRCW